MPFLRNELIKKNKELKIKPDDLMLTLVKFRSLLAVLYHLEDYLNKKRFTKPIRQIIHFVIRIDASDFEILHQLLGKFRNPHS